MEEKSMSVHPTQPFELWPTEFGGQVRFKQNKIIKFLIDLT
jgi:hypothetical protein